MFNGNVLLVVTMSHVLMKVILIIKVFVFTFLFSMDHPAPDRHTVWFPLNNVGDNGHVLR